MGCIRGYICGRTCQGERLYCYVRFMEVVLGANRHSFVKSTPYFMGVGCVGLVFTCVL